jgi:hypothetical protein
MVMSHYIIDLAALATRYVVVDDLDDDGAQDVMNRLDATAADVVADLANAFEEDLLPNAPPTGPLEP